MSSQVVPFQTNWYQSKRRCHKLRISRMIVAKQSFLVNWKASQFIDLYQTHYRYVSLKESMITSLCIFDKHIPDKIVRNIHLHICKCFYLFAEKYSYIDHHLNTPMNTGCSFFYFLKVWVITNCWSENLKNYGWVALLIHNY